ncbi:TetR/AcrR family transcriptional regulator [Agrobacterium sp. FDAARGOS_525]|uniref:TetR/AcrR family transcriptional regulator n=1 Tax=Agrobacterium sp. FDAARGOS_525 TaxID=2420311 RepID=UPI000F6792E8|nr:TetR/AcrR family transcriptional regulator [Agrobacterium sp. FDAARGOS_525]RSC21413.1 TetR/AcrR family transcriptional regulator [Agrobacterium sp. FDAARGOS_525]
MPLKADPLDKPHRRSPGRPPTRPASETQRLLIEAAAAEFLASGYAKTGIETVARRAGISTRTLYRFVANKADLFRMVADQRIEVSISALGELVTEPMSGEAALSQLVRAYTRQALSPEACLTAKMIISEADQFPEVGENYRSSIVRVATAFDERVAALYGDGALDCCSSATASELLRCMIIGVQRQILLGQRDRMSEIEMDELADRCTQLFLRGYRGRKVEC